MNLYRQITEGELRAEIDKMYNEARIWEYEDQHNVMHAIKMMSRREAKQEIKKYFTDVVVCSKFYTRMNKLYFALEWVQSGKPVYTDFMREDN
ncbi:hypothetical protein JBP901_gp112 [Bacillus phage JBP901]|uniref:Uncharacterized protein n=1 Tax=Bacillus phage JBP901 TaxID=1498212 RepID=A0A0E3DEX3_9CAUD|nr:hypothetical protein JBP901_gp112 [Bacillus phage JBP901]AID17824.1 hypothetical protein JBP901_gp112 [Bacillus phage JBP901]